MHENFDFVNGDIVEKSGILNECAECFRLVIEAKYTVFPIGPEASEVSGCLLQFSNDAWQQTENPCKYNQYLCVIDSMLARISEWWKFTPTTFSQNLHNTKLLKITFLIW